MQGPLRKDIGPTPPKAPAAPAPAPGAKAPPPGPSCRAPGSPDADLLSEYRRIRDAMASEPEAVGSRLLLADVCLRLGRKAEAKEILVKALDLEPRARPRILEVLRTLLSAEEINRLQVREERIPFYQKASKILNYPLRGNGPMLLIGGGIVFTGLQFLAQCATIYFWIPLLLCAGYLSSYMMTIIDSSARGNQEPPDYPDFMNIWDSIVGPLWICISSSLIPLILPVAYAFTFGLSLGILPILALIAIGIIYWPMALIAGSIFQNAAIPLNAAFVARAIQVTAKEYFPAVFVIYGLTFMSWLVSFALGLILPSFVAWLASQTTSLYFLMVEMHILGVIYYNHEKALGWFHMERERGPGPRPSRGGTPKDEPAEEKTLASQKR